MLLLGNVFNMFIDAQEQKFLCYQFFAYTNSLFEVRPILGFDEICRLCAFDRVRIPINRAFCEISANRQGSIPCKTGGTFFEEYVWRSEMLLLTLLVALNKKVWVGKFSSQVFRPPQKCSKCQISLTYPFTGFESH